MPVELTDAERADIARIAHNTAVGAIHETLARHFVAVGLERAAVRCEEFALVARDDHEDAASEAMAKTFELAAAGIRALK